MKLFKTTLLAGLVAIGVSSCEVFNMDLQDNPNAVTPENAGIDFLYNNVQLSFRTFYAQASGIGQGPARMRSMGAFTYASGFGDGTGNGIWNTAYAGLFPDMDAVVAIAEPKSLDIHQGTIEIMQAYALVALVDYFGDIPFSEALQGTDIISPNTDDAQAVYSAAEALIDAAIARLTGTQAAKPANDFFYNGDADKWIKFANTLKMKMYLQTKAVDAGAGGKIDAIVASGDFIDSESEDFKWEFGTNRNNPNTRNPWYNEHYESGDGGYMSNYFMWLLYDEKDYGYSDPRIRFYFYRQDRDLTNEDVNIWSCFYSDTPFDLIPDHFTAVDPRMPYCIASSDGYFGRDHGNGSGIPPDGPIRTVWGLYPAGGDFDDNATNEAQQQGTTGALGEGIYPIMMSSFVYFMRAEAGLTMGTSDNPRTMLEAGIRESMATVFAFSGKIDIGKVIGQDVNGNDVTLEDAYLADWDTDVDTYVADVLAEYDAAANDTERLDVIMKEYHIAGWGNGYELYNNVRRTSLPANLQPALEIAPGTFVWSMQYPSSYVDRNANAVQKEITDKIFWDLSASDAVK